MMAYTDQFVLSVIQNHKPVREFSENGKRTCYLNFDQEYKLRLKNKWKDTKAKVKVYIDGMDVMADGSYILLSPGQDLDLERFVSDLKEGSRFKFASLQKAVATGEVQDPYSADNGKIRVEFYKEILPWWRQTHLVTILTSGNILDSLNTQTIGGCFTNSVSNVSQTFNCTTNGVQNNASLTGIQNATSPISDAQKGVTLAGSTSTQQFTQVSDWSTYETTPVIIELALKGHSLETRTTSNSVYEVRIINGIPFALLQNGIQLVTRDQGATIVIGSTGLKVTGCGWNLETTQFKFVV